MSLKRAWIWTDGSMTAVVLEQVPERLSSSFCVLEDGRQVMRPACYPFEQSLALGTVQPAGLPAPLERPRVEPVVMPTREEAQRMVETHNKAWRMDALHQALSERVFS